MLAYSFIVTIILGFLLEKTIGFRISRDAELEGIDLTQHAESAYEFEGSVGGGTFTGGALGGGTAVKTKHATETVSVTDKDSEVTA